MNKWKLILYLTFLITTTSVFGIKAHYSGRNHKAFIQRGDQTPPFDNRDQDHFQDFDGGGVVADILHPLHATATNTHWINGKDKDKGKPKTGYNVVKPHPCEQSSCYPATGNLLIGREHQLFASSTCGLHKQDRYCIVSHLEDPKKCFWCDSRPSNQPKPTINHNISNIINLFYPGTRHKSWWQSENGKEDVYIQLDLEAEFHFTHLIITFKTFRPAAMLIERSYDFGNTWHVYRYFAHNCADSFPGIPKRPPQNLTDVICESRYSGVEPASGGEVIYRVLLPTVRIDNPYSKQVQNLLKMTNLRINFTKLHTLGDDLLDTREEIQEKYYYAITDMVVRGSCSCYGHASRCLSMTGTDPKPDMVYGRCECTHNTKGRNCEKCEDFFNDLPWSPAVGKQTNACKKCSCNNHATSCHFDPAVYEASGRVSGGVCDGCIHNTMGTHCEHCKPFYYKDPSRSIQDPEVCRACDCDPIGSTDGGICDSVTDPINNLIAGSCHCKANVEGRRCDTCKNGFWNFTKDNPDGCEPCTCHTSGTINNQGCNMYSGECTCKRYVTGRDCNQCLPEYFGLSDKQDGCEPCDCDPGGSYDNNCDVITGQCKCRENLTGRRCNTPKQQHFTATLEFLTYEAESSKASPNCQVVIREPYRDGRPNTWTGLGFMKAYENTNIIFEDIDNIKTSLEYDLNIKYENLMPDDWDDATVTLIRPGPPDPNGPCAGITEDDDIRKVSLPSHARSVPTGFPFCLEKDIAYKIQLDFHRYKYDRDTPTASILVDAITLVPRIDKIPMFYGSAPAETRRRIFEQNNCSALQYHKESVIPEICKEYYMSISEYVNNGVYACQCHPTGSTSKLCADYGGNCNCKPNVVGRRCDRCAPGTYDFDALGCKACDCDSIGSLDNFCNVTTGQCKCRANTYGRECNECRLGFWNFPNCQRCECNGHADRCDPRTGACIDCRDHTQGHACDICVEGYYGDPRLNVDIPCRPCPCPAVKGSGHSFADKCSLDPYTKDVVCECQEGYSGAKCDVCADNYYGNPEIPGGSCQPCECNGKIDLLKPGNCDPKTGKCKQCLYDTTGDHCEICKPGYFRLSEDDVCRECVCDILGTNNTAGPCDHNTGQCPCFPHVIGKECDECEINHWKIASGQGCEACNCDPIGSLQQQCDLFYGNCECRPNFGGRQCNECRANHWGDPKQDNCRPCQCKLDGSESLQCDRKTGQCTCLRGIGGYNCDRCDRGFLGNAPHCTPCGECFDNWDRILKTHKNTTLIEIERAKNIKKIGATGAYTKEFDEMQSQLDEIENLLENKEKINLDSIDSQLGKLRKILNETEKEDVKELDEILSTAKEGNGLNQIILERLKESMANLQRKIKDLINNRTELQEANVQGALKLTEEAKEKADRAVFKAQKSHDHIKYAELQCKAAETLVNKTKQDFINTQSQDKESLALIQEDLEDLTDKLPVLSKQVCDGNGEDICHPICGGAGCGSCGDSVSCPEGAKQKIETALLYANETEKILREKEDMANDFIRNVPSQNITLAKNLAQEAHDLAQRAFNSANESMGNVELAIDDIQEFLDGNNTSKEIRESAEMILKKNIESSPQEIKDLAEKIRKAVNSLTNIEPIIAATKDDLAKVKKLSDDAKSAKNQAISIENTTSEVKEALKKSADEQKNADLAIRNVSDTFKSVNDNLQEIGRKTNESHTIILNTEKQINNLTEEFEKLQKQILQNDVLAKNLDSQSKDIAKKANETAATLDSLKTEYKQAKIKLNDTLTKADNSKERADTLVNRAIKLTANITKMDDDIKRLQQNQLDRNLENLEKEIMMLIEKMREHDRVIQEHKDFYNSC